jgi:hypothetical protein
MADENQKERQARFTLAKAAHIGDSYIFKRFTNVFANFFAAL